MKNLQFLAAFFLSGLLSVAQTPKDTYLEMLMHPEHSMGELAGLLTESTVILQSRLTFGDLKINNDIPGYPGWAGFEISADDGFKDSWFTDWMEAKPENDYIIKVMVENLEPNTRYYYRLLYGNSPEEYRTGQLNTFITNAGAELSRELSLVVVTGMNLDRYMRTPGRKMLNSMDRHLGFPAAESVLKRQPDYFVGTGDNVYYDASYLPFGQAVDKEGMRNCYHELLYQPRMKELFSNVATYWEKDDHDFRYNDCDNTGDRLPLPGTGIKMFIEQLPVAAPGNKNPKTYSTHRLSRDLQIWLLEGRDYRSPNSMQDGPEKTIWGKEQKDWLKETLLSSNASYKVIISPTPMVGPDDSYKKDNHTNWEGFRSEGLEFFGWLTKNGFLDKNLYLVCGDRHWQYHSIHPSGFEEFSCGAFADANSRVGRLPGDPESTDPDKTVSQPYCMTEASGGFLQLNLILPDSKPVLVFNFYDEKGLLLYSEMKVAH